MWITLSPPFSTLFDLQLSIPNNIFSQVQTSLAENQPPKEWISHLLKVREKEMYWCCGWSIFFQGRLTRSWTNGTTTTPSPGAGLAWAKTTSPSPSGPSTTSEASRSPPSSFDRLHWVEPLFLWITGSGKGKLLIYFRDTLITYWRGLILKRVKCLSRGLAEIFLWSFCTYVNSYLNVNSGY